MGRLRMRAGRWNSRTKPGPGVRSPPADPLASAKAAHLRNASPEGPGISPERRGKGFCYIGPDLKPVRDEATLQRIRSLVIPLAWRNVWICPIADGHIQTVGRDGKDRKQYRFHPRSREVRDETKFHLMLAFGAASQDSRTNLQSSRQRRIRADERVIRTDDAARSACQCAQRKCGTSVSMARAKSPGKISRPRIFHLAWNRSHGAATRSVWPGGSGE